jgi:tRNA G10  N-methylase Trm11
MIKALINVMGLKPGDTVLDPMMGSVELVSHLD